MVMPHAALNDVKSMDDIVRYWEARHEAAAEASAAAAQHFTVAHPSNVFIAGKGRGPELLEWLEEHGRRGDLDDDDDDDGRGWDEAEEEDDDVDELEDAVKQRGH